MTGEECVIWLKHFMLPQQGGDSRKFFKFQQVYVPLDHQFPDHTTFVSKTKVSYRNNNAFLVRNEGTLDKPQMTKPISYPKASWDYLYFHKNNSGLNHWHGLPSRPDHPAEDVISESETATNVSRFSTLDSDQSSVLDMVKELITVVNEHEQHVPVIVSRV